MTCPEVRDFFVTLFFVIPVIPVSGVHKLLECPNCKTRYQQDS